MFRTITLFTFIMCFSFYNQSHVIGILALEIKGRDKETYFNTSYSKWLEQNNVQWIPISMYESDAQITQKLEKINGVFLTGGSQDLYDKDKNPTQYLKVTELIIKYAKQQFDNGVPFPVIGTCMGFEIMVHVLSNKELYYVNAQNNNYSISIAPLPEIYDSRFFNKLFSYNELVFWQENIFHFHHDFGYLMEDVQNSRSFQTELTALAYYFTIDNRPGMAIFEHKFYPFIGWQFHPEKVQFEHNLKTQLNKSWISIEQNAKFSRFFEQILEGQEVKADYEWVMDQRRSAEYKVNFASSDESFAFKLQQQLYDQQI